jgi:hypothetical protein
MESIDAYQQNAISIQTHKPDHEMLAQFEAIPGKTGKGHYPLIVAHNPILAANEIFLANSDKSISVFDIGQGVV